MAGIGFQYHEARSNQKANVLLPDRRGPVFSTHPSRMAMYGGRHVSS